MAKKMLERQDLTPETMLTVKEAAYLANMSVPAFYTKRNKGLLGFANKTNGVWLIRVKDLVDNEFLTEDFEPKKSERMYGDPSQRNEGYEPLAREIEELKARIEYLHEELGRQMDEKKDIQRLADERGKQLEMIDALLVASGLKKEQ